MQRDAAIYVRISSDPQGLALGVTRQEEDGRKAAAALSWRIHGVYVDNDVGAFSGKRRPEYERMLDDIRAGRVNAVIVWDLDRLTRRPLELEHFMELAEKYDVALKNIGGEIDLSTRMGRMMARIKGAVARQESEATRDRVQRSNDQLARTGKTPSGRRAFGYSPGGMDIDEAEAAIIRELAQRVLAGEGCTGLANDLNRRGIVTPYTGGPWDHTVVREMLLSPRRAGLRTLRGEIVAVGEWPAILGRDVWEAVCAELQARRKSRPRGVRERRYLLTGIAVCDKCRQPVGTFKSREKRRYRCNVDGCRAVVREVTAVDEFVIGAALVRLADPRLSAAIPSPPTVAGDELVALEARRRQIIDELGDDDALSVELAKAAVKRIDERLTGLRQRAAAARAQHVLGGTAGLDRDGWDAIPLERRRAIIRTLFAVTLVPIGRSSPRRFVREGVRLEPRTLT